MGFLGFFWVGFLLPNLPCRSSGGGNATSGCSRRCGCWARSDAPACSPVSAPRRSPSLGSWMLLQTQGWLFKSVFYAKFCATKPLRKPSSTVRAVNPKRTRVSSSVADPDPGSGAFLIPRYGIRDGYKIRIRIRDEQPGSYFRELLRNYFLEVKILKFFDAGLGRKKIGSGMEKLGSGILDSDPG